MKFIEELEAKLKLNYQKFIEIDKSITLYHYTPLKNLESIIKSGELWMSDYSSLNDTSEVLYTHNIFIDFLEKRIASLKNEGSLEAWKYFLKTVKENIVYSSNKKDKFLLGPFGLNTEYNHFIFSLSKSHDYLPLWRYYADNGGGISIGMEFNILNKKNKKEEEKIEEIFSAEVNYKEEVLLEYLDKWFLQTQKFLKNNTNIRKAKARYLRFCVKTSSYVISLYPYFKHPDFKSEKEYRMCTIIDKVTGKELLDNNKIEKTDNENAPKSNKFLKDDYNTSKYRYKYKFDKNSIKEIYIGPKLKFEETRDFIKSKLSEFGYPEDIEIKASEKPYR